MSLELATSTTSSSLYIYALVQTVFGRVRMEEPWMQEPACVTVKVTSVDLTVKVSALCVV